MATGGQKRTRSERVAAIELPPGQWERAWINLRRRDVLGRVILAFAAAVATCIVIRGWDPPFVYRSGLTPHRDIVARTTFQQEDKAGTALAKELAKKTARLVYAQNPLPLKQLRDSLRNAVLKLTAAETLGDADRAMWRQLVPPLADGAAPPAPAAEDAQFQEFRKALTGPDNVARFERSLAAAFAPFERRGLLTRPPKLDEGNQDEILVFTADKPDDLQPVKMADVLIGDGSAMWQSLQAEFADPAFAAAGVADHLFNWVKLELLRTNTLTLNDEQTNRQREEAKDAVEPVLKEYAAGQPLAKAGQPLAAEQVALLRLEYDAMLAEQVPFQQVARGAAIVVMVFAAFVLCGVYMRYRQRGPLLSVIRLTMILVLAVLTVALARWASDDAWRAEIIPLMLLGMTVAIAYRQELAVLASCILSLITAVAIGFGLPGFTLPGFVMLMGVTTVASLNVGRIRTRTKLIAVGLAAGCVAAVLYVCLATLESQPLGWSLLLDAARYGLWALAAGFLMAGLLPFIERLFGVLTDLSLLELGDVTHPLLQELVRRAPSTYNHSLTVGAIAEAAAESIGARGLLVRIGAYFHDIGKMLKPAYFIENQGTDANLHETLVPAMSTLVIIAHLKDGIDLARQHRLPQPIIDLLAQHHGTSLVGYFYGRATEQQQADPNGGEVDENRFRYPGPKPQTKEAAVLMLADSVESASRTLIDPLPARIESLVREIAEGRLHDGQFDESGLTLRELRTIEKSLVMSLTSIYHGRIKYPEQKTG
jgi:putative nucleotidyltransferase with HDIG domain